MITIHNRILKNLLQTRNVVILLKSPKIRDVTNVTQTQSVSQTCFKKIILFILKAHESVLPEKSKKENNSCNYEQFFVNLEFRTMATPSN